MRIYKLPKIKKSDDQNSLENKEQKIGNPSPKRKKYKTWSSGKPQQKQAANSPRRLKFANNLFIKTTDETNEENTLNVLEKAGMKNEFLASLETPPTSPKRNKAEEDAIDIVKSAKQHNKFFTFLETPNQQDNATKIIKEAIDKKNELLLQKIIDVDYIKNPSIIRRSKAIFTALKNNNTDIVKMLWDQYSKTKQQRLLENGQELITKIQKEQGNTKSIKFLQENHTREEDDFLIANNVSLGEALESDDPIKIKKILAAYKKLGKTPGTMEAKIFTEYSKQASKALQTLYKLTERKSPANSDFTIKLLEKFVQSKRNAHIAYSMFTDSTYQKGMWDNRIYQKTPYQEPLVEQEKRIRLEEKSDPFHGKWPAHIDYCSKIDRTEKLTQLFLCSKATSNLPTEVIPQIIEITDYLELADLKKGANKNTVATDKALEKEELSISREQSYGRMVKIVEHVKKHPPKMEIIDDESKGQPDKVVSKPTTTSITISKIIEKGENSSRYSKAPDYILK